jgi:uncharacterized protein
VRVAVRARPGARRAAVGGRWDGPRGPALLVAVRARAAEGAANDAVVAAVAAAFGVRPSAVALVAGGRSRDKVLEVTGDEGALAARLGELLA